MDDLSKLSRGLGSAGGADVGATMGDLAGAIDESGGLDGLVAKLRDGGLDHAAQCGLATVMVGDDPASGDEPQAPKDSVDLLSYGEPTEIGFDTSAPDRRFDYRIGRRPGFLDGRPGLPGGVTGLPGAGGGQGLGSAVAEFFRRAAGAFRLEWDEPGPRGAVPFARLRPAEPAGQGAGGF